MSSYGASTIAGEEYDSPVTITYPTGITNGQLLIAVVSGFGTYSSFTPPAGWTTVINNEAASGHVIAMRIADGTETGTVVFNIVGMGEAAAVMYRITGHGVSVVGDLIAATLQGGELTTAPQLTGVAAGSLVITSIYHKFGAEPVTPSGFTSAEAAGFDGEAFRMESAYQAGMSGTVGTFDWTGSLGSSSSLAIPPAASGPTLSLPTATSIAQTTATLGFTTDSATGTGYVVVTTSATEPSAAQIKAGDDHTGADAVFAGTNASLSVGTNTFSATGLTAPTQYYYYIIQNDGSEDSNIVSDDFTTLDVDRPTLTSPTQINVGTSTVTPRVTTDTSNGTAYFVITPSAEGSPSREQIEDGENAAGGAPTAAGSQSVSEAGVITFSEATGLTPNVEYRIGYTHLGTPPA